MDILFFKAIYLFLTIISFLIIASAILSWFPVPALNGIKQLLYKLTDPILTPIRKMIQKSIFGSSHMTIDFSPFIAYLIVTTIQRFIQTFFLLS